MNSIQELHKAGVIDKDDLTRQILNLPETKDKFLKAFSVDVNGKIIDFNPNASSIGANDDSIDKLSTVQAGLLAKCLPISIMEIFVFKTNKDGTREKVPEHFLQFKLNKKPNSYTTRNKWFQTAVYHLGKYENHYAIPHDKGKELELEMIHPNLVEIRKGRGEGGKPFLIYKIEGFKKTFQSWEIIHVKGFGEHATGGEKLSTRAGEVFKWEMSLGQFGQGFFDNGAKPANVITQDILLGSNTLEQQKQMRDDFVNHQGSNTGGTKVLQPGWDIKNTAHSNEQNQYIESKTHAIQNGARVLNVPLHKLKELSRGTYNNLAVVEQSFARDSLQPITESIEAEYADKLFTKKELDSGYELVFDFKKLLKFDPVARSQYYNTGISSGYMTQNQVRKEEGENPYSGVGDEPMVNGGMVFIKDLGQGEETNE